MIVIIDYKIGNLGSIKNMLKKAGHLSIITSDLEQIRKADRIILPGVGHFSHGMGRLRESGLIEILNVKAKIDKVPILGICLGAQLLTNSSEEGNEMGLGWIDAEVMRFNENLMIPQLPVPNMGWCDVKITNTNKLVEDLPSNPRFYFVHSYHIVCKNVQNEILEAEYGYPFTAAICQDNIYGVQFHPEKSHKFGMKLLDNFCKL
ncbi:MAG: imidazole glycerol phosphate synthase subunit HisH [Chitinophagia bacterium]|jgi:glutamine amidotransferase